jgi:hypothetical protein
MRCGSFSALPGIVIFSIVLGVGILVAPTKGRAEVYQYVDKNGTVHYTDRIEDLPEPYRSKAWKEYLEKQEQKKKTAPQPSGQSGGLEPLPDVSHDRIPPQNTSSSDTSGSSSDTYMPSVPKGPDKSLWQGKAEQAKKRVEELEQRCQDLEKQRGQNAQNNLLFSRPMDREAAQKSTAESSKCQEDLKAARRYLDEDLPEEARKAGVPPGWLR